MYYSIKAEEAKLYFSVMRMFYILEGYQTKCYATLMEYYPNIYCQCPIKLDSADICIVNFELK